MLYCKAVRGLLENSSKCFPVKHNLSSVSSKCFFSKVEEAPLLGSSNTDNNFFTRNKIKIKHDSKATYSQMVKLNTKSFSGKSY